MMSGCAGRASDLSCSATCKFAATRHDMLPSPDERVRDRPARLPVRQARLGPRTLVTRVTTKHYDSRLGSCAAGGRLLCRASRSIAGHARPRGSITVGAITHPGVAAMKLELRTGDCLTLDVHVPWTGTGLYMSYIRHGPRVSSAAAGASQTVRAGEGLQASHTSTFPPSCRRCNRAYQCRPSSRRG